MGIQLVICVESSRRAGTDNIYINETIKRLYSLDNEVRLSFVNMDGKSKYKDASVLKQIRQYIRDYKIGTTVVIYCFDTDKFEANPDQLRENKEIKSFISMNGYELVWFCHDIEEVYLKQSVDKSEKKKRAVEYKTSHGIDSLDLQNLLSKDMTKCKSNLLTVLDKYLRRKEIIQK